MPALRMTEADCVHLHAFTPVAGSSTSGGGVSGGPAVVGGAFDEIVDVVVGSAVVVVVAAAATVNVTSDSDVSAPITAATA